MNNNSEFMPVECLNVPKVLFYDKQYEDLSMDAKLICTAVGQKGNGHQK